MDDEETFTIKIMRDLSSNQKLLLYLGLCLLVLASGSFWSEKLPRFLGLAPSYRDFVDRDQEYYAEVVKGCTDLLSRPVSEWEVYAIKNVPDDQSGLKEWWFRGNDKWLPSPLCNIHAKDIRIISEDGKNHIWINVVDSRAGWGIAWAPSRDDYKTWKLTADNESWHPVLYPSRTLKLNNDNSGWLAEKKTDLNFLLGFTILALLFYLLFRWNPKGQFANGIRRLLFLADVLIFSVVILINLIRYNFCMWF